MTNNNKSSKKRFLYDHLYILIRTIHEQYYVHKKLRENRDKIRNKYPYFFDSILYSLENSLFADLATLFSNNNKYEQISFNSILKLLDKEKRKSIEEKIKSNSQIVNKIVEWRNKNKSHKNLKVSMEPEKFEKEYNLKFSELEKILNPSREIYDDIEFILKNEKNPFIISDLRHDLELEIQSIVTKLS